jgi:hypothetical protein
MSMAVSDAVAANSAMMVIISVSRISMNSIFVCGGLLVELFCVFCWFGWIVGAGVGVEMVMGVPQR